MTSELNDWFERILRCRQRTAAQTVTKCLRKVAEIKKEEKRIEAERKRREEYERIKKEEEGKKRQKTKLSMSTRVGSTLVRYIEYDI